MEQNDSIHKDSALIRLVNGAGAPGTAYSGKTIGEGMKEQNSFGALLKRYRLTAGLSQEALDEPFPVPSGGAGTGPG